MNAQQIHLVKSTFATLAPHAESVGMQFYSVLFKLDPALKPLFKGDMKAQAQKLMQMVAVAVNALDDVEKIVPAVQALGTRHAGYGVKAADYDTVGSALLTTLESGLGNAFTPDVKEAWTQTYTLLAGVMKDAAASK